MFQSERSIREVETKTKNVSFLDEEDAISLKLLSISSRIGFLALNCQFPCKKGKNINKPAPSKGCQKVTKGLSIHHPLGFNWHRFEGAGICFLQNAFSPEETQSNLHWWLMLRFCTFCWGGEDEDA